MQGTLMYYVFLMLVFGSVFLVVRQFINQKQEMFLRLPVEEAMGKEEKERVTPKVFKTLTPISAKLLPLLKQEQTKRALICAGAAMSVLEFLSFKLLAGLFGLVVGVILFSSKPMYIVVACAVAFFYPDLWLKQKISKRQRTIRQDLPNVIDLLNLCVNAGVDFMLAVNRVIKEYKPCPLRDELSEVWRESQIGRSRREALRGLAWRVNLPEMTSFVRTLIQADKMGAPMGEALRIQAEEIRIRRFHHGEEEAAKAPIKLLFPLLFFIMPVVLVIIAGPILLQFAGGGLKM